MHTGRPMKGRRGMGRANFGMPNKSVTYGGYGGGRPPNGKYHELVCMCRGWGVGGGRGEKREVRRLDVWCTCACLHIHACRQTDRQTQMHTHMRPDA